MSQTNKQYPGILTDSDNLKKSTAIINGTILTMDSQFSQYNNGMIIYSGDSIDYAGARENKLLKQIPIGNVIDAEGGIIIPGLINTHTHIGMSFFRTLADDRANRLEKVIFPLEKKYVTEDLVYWASLHTITEMIMGGTTTFADMYYFEGMTAKAAQKGGLRAILGESVTSAPSPDSGNAIESIERTRELISNFKNSRLITPAIAPHAPYSLSRGDLELVSAFASDKQIPILSHLAEMPFEESYIKEKYNMMPIPYYDSCGLLTDHSTMAHCIFADRKDRELLITRKTGISHNVSANSKSGKGIAPAYEFFSEGGRIGLGTDGPMSGNTMDMVHQLGLVSKFQKVRMHDPTIMTPIQVLEMATIGGARSLHLEKLVGSIERGKRADITIFSTDSAAMFPIYDPYSALVYCASPSDISTVLVDGKILLHRKKLLNMDTSGIREAASSYIDKIRREML